VAALDAPDELTRGCFPNSPAATVATVQGTHVGRYVMADGALEGQLANGPEVMVLRLGSGGSGGIFYALIFTRIHGAITFVS
jgi:hypothetical protein